LLRHLRLESSLLISRQGASGHRSPHFAGLDALVNNGPPIKA
jgi:hypothetical protein